MSPRTFQAEHVLRRASASALRVICTRLAAKVMLPVALERGDAAPTQFDLATLLIDELQRVERELGARVVRDPSEPSERDP